MGELGGQGFPDPSNHLPSATNKPFTQFPTNFTLLPTVSFVVPTLAHDMHDGTRKQGDDWLLANMDAYAQWAKTHNSLLIVTWDKDDSTPPINPHHFLRRGIEDWNNGRRNVDFAQPPSHA